MLCDCNIQFRIDSMVRSRCLNHHLLIGTDSLAWISTRSYRDTCKIQNSHRRCDETKCERGVRAQLSHLTAPHHIGRPTATLGAAAQEMVENVKVNLKIKLP